MINICLMLLLRIIYIYIYIYTQYHLRVSKMANYEIRKKMVYISFDKEQPELISEAANMNNEASERY